MVHRISPSPLTSPAELDRIASPTSPSATSAVTLAPTGTSRGTPITHRDESRATRDAVVAALSGSPDALVAFITIKLRNSQASTQSHIANVAGQAARDAERARQEATRKAEEAAHAATGFLGLGDTFGWLVKIAAVVVAATASVVTGGALAGLAAAAGAVLLTCGDDIAKKLGEAGWIPPELVDTVAFALKITGAVMMGGGVLTVAAGIAGAALTSYAGDIAKGLAAEHVIGENDVGPMTIGLSLAGAALGIAGGAIRVDSAAASGDAVATEIARTTGSAGRALGAGATVAQGGMRIAAGIENHDAAEDHADAKIAGQRSDAARDDQSEANDTVRDIVRSIAKLMSHLRSIEEAKNEAHRVAAQGRA